MVALEPPTVDQSGLGDVVDIGFKLSEQLNCGLSKESIATILMLMTKYPQLQPEVLAHIIREVPVVVEKRRSRRKV